MINISHPLLTLLQPFISGSRCPAPPLRAHLWWLPLLMLPWPLPPPWECWSSSNTGHIMPHHCSVVFTAAHRIKAILNKDFCNPDPSPSLLLSHPSCCRNPECPGPGLELLYLCFCWSLQTPDPVLFTPQNTFIPQRSITCLPQDTVTPPAGDSGLPQSWLWQG